MKSVSKFFKIVLNAFFIIWLFINSVLIVKGILDPKNVPSFLGFKPYVVISGSNETDMEYGDFVITKNVKELKKDDIVVVKTEDRKATSYRIESIEDNILKLRNATNTKIFLSKDSIEGKCIICVKKMGKLALLLRNVIIVIISIVLSVIAGFLIYGIKNIFEE